MSITSNSLVMNNDFFNYYYVIYPFHNKNRRESLEKLSMDISCCG